MDFKGIFPGSFRGCFAIFSGPGFEEIGMLLEVNQMPDPALRCDQSYVPNIIFRDGATIRISHPNPSQYGFSQIYVSNASHEPVFVE